MKKIAIFNVGGALSSYAEFDDKKILIDLGKSSDFSPVDNFLIPFTKVGKFKMGDRPEIKDKYVVDQLFLSHLDKDHISDYDRFRKYFYSIYMTCPNDNETQYDEFKINRDLIASEYDARNVVLEDMKGRSTKVENNYNMSMSNPLVSTIDQISLFYIKPSVCELEKNLINSYANNVSLVLFIQVNDKTLLLPGDILKEGMMYLINSNRNFNTLLSSNGIDYLVAPHHGLETAFSEYLFRTINGNKTRLNIISEKVREEENDENRSDVDSRYYSSNYSTGENAIAQYAVKTSKGHIVIDFETDDTDVKQYSDIQAVIKEFYN